MHFNKFNGQRKEWFTRKSCAVSFAYNNLQSDLTQPTEYKLNRIQSYGYRGRIFSVENSEVKLLISCLAHTKMVERSTKKKIHYIISFSNDINTQSGSRVATKKFSISLPNWVLGNKP